MDIQKKLISAYLWSVCGKWGVRCLGIGSTLILVRLIEPESFGLVALSTICIGFFETIHTIGIGRYLMTQTDLSQDSINSSWTLNIILKLIMSIGLVILSPYIAVFFNEPNLELIIQVVAINGFFKVFNNLGMIRLRKNLEFKKITYLEVVSKVFSTVVTLILAFISPNHWALIIGSGSYVWIYLIGSYYIYDYRPQLRFKFEKEMFSFSAYMIFRNILSYLRNRGDVFIVSKLFDTSSIGKYKIGLDFAVMPFSEVIAPAGQAIFPGMANFKHNKEELFDKTYKYLALVYLFVIPCIVGIWYVAPQFCTVILGEKWADTAPIMSSLAILMLSYPISAMTNNLYDYLGNPKLGIFNDLVGLSLLVLVSTAIAFDDVAKFAELRGYVGITIFIFVIAFAKLTINFSIRKMLEVIIVPIVASMMMPWVFNNLYLNVDMTFLGLMSNILIGVISYSVCLVVLVSISKPYSKIWQFWFDKAVSASVVVKNRVVRNSL